MADEVFGTVNPFRRPHGPERMHIALIQKLFWEDGMPVDQVAGVMVEVFPMLEKGAKTGREVERREMVWELVNVWVSKWAEWVVYCAVWGRGGGSNG